MNELVRRRRALMAEQKDGKIWLYDNGVTSDVIGGWNTTGYKYGSNFAQAEQSASLCIYATNKYNNKGGRTFTSNNALTSKHIGKTLHVIGYFKLNGDLRGGRSSYVYAFISDAVQDVSNVESVLSSGAFTGNIHTSSGFGLDAEPGKTVDFEMILPITKAGYLSFVLFKGYSGLLYSYFKEAWIE